MHPEDGGPLGLESGDRVRVTTRRGSVETIVDLTDTMQPGHISLPNGLGLKVEDADGTAGPGAAPNELTSGGDADWLAGTPWLKHVPARVELVAS
jgi:formate dehydrogenase